MEENLIKKKSEIQGFGIFTGKLIKKGIRFYIIPLDKTYKTPKKRCAKIKEVYVDDKKILNWVNHSCEPNTKICFMGGKPALKSLRDIKKGEELLTDYNKTELKKNKKTCNCKSEKCKGDFYQSN
ncbi:SET domain-containing protein-lysine N-methyltransferase [Nanoarchaeota archaeon]